MSLVETKYFISETGITILVINGADKLPVVEVTSTRWRNMNACDLVLGPLGGVTWTVLRLPTSVLKYPIVSCRKLVFGS